MPTAKEPKMAAIFPTTSSGRLSEEDPENQLKIKAGWTIKIAPVKENKHEPKSNSV